jgi:photosystem II stability/assembly factor-like uncharacterized protein
MRTWRSRRSTVDVTKTLQHRSLSLSGLVTLALLGCGEAAYDAPREDDEPLAPEVHESELSLRAEASWTRIGEELPGPVTLVVDRWLPNVVYAGSSSGIFASWSLGERWSRAQLGGQAYGVAVDPNRPGSALAYSETALFETRNAGLTWHRLDVTLPGRLRAIAPGNSSVLWAEGSPFLYKSVDRGASWTRLDFGGPGGCCLDLLALSETDLYASAYYAQLQRSFDGGVTWPLTTFADLYMVPTFAVQRRHPEVVYAGSYLPFGPSGLRKSTNGARTWTAPNADLASAQVRSVAVSDVDGRLYVVTSASDGRDTLYISTDGGSSFEQAPADVFAGAASFGVVPHPSLRCVAFAETSTGLYRTTSAGGTCQ